MRNPGLVVVMRSEIFIAEPNSDRFALVPFLYIAGVERIANGHPRHPPTSTQALTRTQG